jgi:vesicle-fusing ATPase
MADFERALQEVRPAFGADEEQFEGCKLNGIVSWDIAVDLLLDTGKLLAQLVANSARAPLVSLLLEGEPGAGKSSLAVEMAQASGFPYIKMISPEQLVGQSELGKLAKINKVCQGWRRRWAQDPKVQTRLGAPICL